MIKDLKELVKDHPFYKLSLEERGKEIQKSFDAIDLYHANKEKEESANQEDELYYDIRLTETQINKILEELEYVKKNTLLINPTELQDLITEIKEQYATRKSSFNVYFRNR